MYLCVRWWRICHLVLEKNILFNKFGTGHRFGSGSGPNPWTGRTDGWQTQAHIEPVFIRFSRFSVHSILTVSVRFWQFRQLTADFCFWSKPDFFNLIFLRFLNKKLSLWPNLIFGSNLFLYLSSIIIKPKWY
jgi:hypothetical protein